MYSIYYLDYLTSLITFESTDSEFTSTGVTDLPDISATTDSTVSKYTSTDIGAYTTEITDSPDPSATTDSTDSKYTPTDIGAYTTDINDSSTSEYTGNEPTPTSTGITGYISSKSTPIGITESKNPSNAPYTSESTFTDSITTEASVPTITTR